jgi:ferrochelatase
MTYGSPSSLDDVGRYLTAIRGGRPPDPDVVAEFRRRYEVIGGSPLVPITRRQAAAVEEAMGGDVAVRAAMRFSEPSVETALRHLQRLGVKRAAGIVLSPQYSPLLMGGYERALDAARGAIGAGAPEIEMAGAWYREPAFVAAMAGRIREGLAGSGDPGRVPVLLTAHSLPRKVADREPGYIDQLRDSATLIAAAAGLTEERWRFCWQSAGHEPGAWMTPDFADLMPELRAQGHAAVLVAPIQFLADHLEVLYDVDVGAREQAHRAGLAFRRTASLNDDPGFIEALATIARRALGGVPA